MLTFTLTMQSFSQAVLKIETVSNFYRKCTHCLQHMRFIFMHKCGPTQKNLLTKNSSSVIACSHQRCADYFMESIRSTVGFYGRPCQSYLHYILGLCRHKNANRLAGEHCADNNDDGSMYFVRTNAKYPYAKGQNDTDGGARRRTSHDLNDDGRIQMERYLKSICNSDDDDDGDVESFKQFLNCKRFEPKVLTIGNAN